MDALGWREFDPLLVACSWLFVRGVVDVRISGVTVWEFVLSMSMPLVPKLVDGPDMVGLKSTCIGDCIIGEKDCCCPNMFMEFMSSLIRPPIVSVISNAIDKPEEL